MRSAQLWKPSRWSRSVFLFFTNRPSKSRASQWCWNYISPFKGSTVREQSTVARCDDVSSVNYPGDGDRNRKKSLVFFLCSLYVSLTVCYYYKICRHTLVRYKHESLPAKPTDRYNTILSLASLVLWFFFFSPISSCTKTVIYFYSDPWKHGFIGCAAAFLFRTSSSRLVDARRYPSGHYARFQALWRKLKDVTWTKKNVVARRRVISRVFCISARGDP